MYATTDQTSIIHTHRQLSNI